MILLIPCVICALSALSFLPDYNSMCCPTHPGRLADSPQSLNPWTPCVCGRLEDDDRLDTILGNLRRKAPSVLGPNDQSQGHSHSESGMGSDVLSAKGELALQLKEVRGRVKGLEEHLTARRKAAARN